LTISTLFYSLRSCLQELFLTFPSSQLHRPFPTFLSSQLHTLSFLSKLSTS
jgi:hypothetical protein